MALKELRETHVWIKVIKKSGMIKPAEQLDGLLEEADELIAIVFASIRTAKRRDAR